MWPLYSYVAPLSWMIEKDVRSGRSHMNLSHWDAYSEDQKVELLTNVGLEVIDECRCPNTLTYIRRLDFRMTMV